MNGRVAYDPGGAGLVVTIYGKPVTQGSKTRTKWASGATTRSGCARGVRR